MKSGSVAIVGRPNSGKSTLLNALVGQKISIVSDKPQTTRNRILGVHTEDRGQISFLDTPGIHKPNYRMNQRMFHAITESLREADLVILMIDGSASYGAGEKFALEMVRSSKVPAMLVINKIDKIAKPKLLPIMERYAGEHQFVEIIPASALTSDNVDLILDKVYELLPERDPEFDREQVTDRTERFLTAEFIREKILERTREEIPYATAVLIRKFDETERATRNLVVIEAEILVEKRSQQGIILGAGGTQIRDVGTAARRDLEALLGCRVYLALEVRTVRKWRDNDTVLDDLGVGS